MEIKITDKNPRNKLTDTIVASRWAQIALNGTVLVFCAFTGWADFQVGSYAAFGTMCFVIGVNATIILFTFIVPGLFRVYGDAERAIIKAQIEKDMGAAIAEIKRQHPEIEGVEIQRVQ